MSAQPDATQSPHTQPQAYKAGPADMAQGGPYRVLIVDPVHQHCLHLAELINAQGHVVERCEDEDRAVEILEEGSWQVVVFAPDGDSIDGGLCMLNWMHLRHPTVQAVVVSPPGSGARALKIANSGAVALVQTPVDPAALGTAIERAARQHALRELAQQRHEEVYVQRRHIDAMSRVFETALMHLSLVYQPIVRAQTGCIVGYEALLRTSTLRFEGAGPMLDLARRLGRQSEVDDRVRSLAAFLFEDTIQHRTIFMNFEVGELTRGIFGTRRDPLAPYANRVVVEFGHEGHLPDGPEISQTLARMRGSGYRIAAGGIAGTVAGLTRMRVLAPDIYKLGACVVQGSDQDPAKRQHMERLVKLAHDEGALVVAQGIERPEERTIAADLGCDLLQGYFLGMPKLAFD